MLHVLWLIFKIIGIILAVLLVLLILVVCALLFVPVRYTIDAKYYDGHPDIRIKISWLLSIVRARFVYKEKLKAKVKLLFVTLYDADRPGPKKKVKNDFGKNEKTAKNVFDDSTAGIQREEMPKAVQKPDTTGVGVETDDEAALPECINEASVISPDVSGGHEENEANQTVGPKGFFGKIADKCRKIIQAAARFFRKVWLAAAGFFKGIRDTGENIQKRVCTLLEQINDPDNRELVRFLWAQIRLLFAKLKPRQCKIYVHFGTGDIELTGKIAMYAAVLYGFMGMDMQIIPDFEQTVLEGEVRLKGHIRLFGLLIIILRVYRNRLVQKIILKKQK